MRRSSPRWNGKKPGSDGRATRLLGEEEGIEMEEEKSYAEIVKWGLGSLVAVLAVTWLGFYVHGMSIADTRLFGVPEENARREVFEQTKSYRDGVRRDFDELLLAYAKASPEERPAIVSIMRHRAESAPADLVPAEVKALIGGGR